MLLIGEAGLCCGNKQVPNRSSLKETRFTSFVVDPGGHCTISFPLQFPGVQASAPWVRFHC